MHRKWSTSRSERRLNIDKHLNGASRLYAFCGGFAEAYLMIAAYTLGPMSDATRVSTCWLGSTAYGTRTTQKPDNWGKIIIIFVRNTPPICYRFVTRCILCVASRVPHIFACKESNKHFISIFCWTKHFWMPWDIDGVVTWVSFHLNGLRTH